MAEKHESVTVEIPGGKKGDVQVDIEDGALTLSIPKTEAVKPRSVAIK